MRKMFAVMLMALTLAACGPGEPGPAGPPGPQGPKGDSGMEIRSNGFCSQTGTLNGNPVVLQHRVTDFSDGSTFTSCAVSLTPGTNSTASFFNPESNGATDGSCLVVSDVDAPSFGYWSFMLPAGASTAVATYHDEDSIFDGTIYHLPCTF
jgi:hypothetical protein